MPTLHGKVALVTGASSGIGRATCLALARSGAKVVAADLQDKLGEQMIQEIQAAGGEATYIHCDVSQAADLRAAVQASVETYGGLDIAVNNAGITGEQGPIAEQTTENWDRVIAVNLTGVFGGMRAEIPAMLEGDGGAIVNVSSIAGKRGFPGIAPYTASKHGVIGLTRAAALEYAGEGLRINALCPGVIRTPMVDRYVSGDPEAEAALTSQEPVGRMGEPEEMADVILWLCSEEASFVTGQAIAADGGWTAR